MKEDYIPKLIEVLGDIIKRRPANWALKIIMAIGVFIIGPITGTIPHYTNFSFLLVLLTFFIAIFFNMMVESLGAKSNYGSASEGSEKR
ncbi:hypothetical protein C5S53_17740 [Methanophagales archaeon]|nr:hypothetical protein C5S53_17740 [Methanophagales archaeon]